MRRDPLRSIAVLVLLLAGCGEGPEPGDDDLEPAPIAAPPPSDWREADGSPQVAVDPERPMRALEAATAEARRTMAGARERFARRAGDDPARWFVKWAAPTEAGGVEAVWVEVLAWSPWRAEGRLASPPQSPLASGHGLDDFVSAPDAELVDWMVYATGDLDGAFEGGTTVRALEERFGPVERATPDATGGVEETP